MVAAVGLLTIIGAGLWCGICVGCNLRIKTQGRSFYPGNAGLPRITIGAMKTARLAHSFTRLFAILETFNCRYTKGNEVNNPVLEVPDAWMHSPGDPSS
jgi:hypothetical protein